MEISVGQTNFQPMQISLKEVSVGRIGCVSGKWTQVMVLVCATLCYKIVFSVLVGRTFLMQT